MNDMTDDRMSFENIAREVGGGLDGMEKFVELILGDNAIGKLSKDWMECTLIIINDSISELLDVLESMFASTGMNTKFMGRNTEGTKSLKVIDNGPRIPNSWFKI
jgi:hypothetical protein